MYGDSIATRVYRATLRLLLGALIPLAACVVSDALTGPGVAPVLLRYSGDTLLVVGDTVALALTAQVGGTPVAQSRFRYAIEDTTIVSQTARGDSLVAKRRGRTRLTASLVSSVLPDPPPSVTVTLDAVVGAVTVTPAADTLRSLLDTLTLSAAALDAHGNPIAGVSPTWTSSDTSVAALVAPGRLVARGNGQATIRALVDGDTGTASVVVAQRIARLRVSPGVLALSALTAESTLVATALDARDNAIPGVAVTWTSSALSIATVTVGGRVRAVDNGTALIQATSGLVRDTATVVVEQQANRVVISPDPVAPITALGDQQFFTASATDSLGFVVTVPNKAAGWATLDPAVVTVDRTGLVTGVGVGSGHIIAVMDAARDTAIVPVGDLPVSVDVQPGAATLASVHDTLPVTVTVRNSRGNLIQNPAVVWRTSDASIVQVDTATRPLAIAMRAGTARVIATAGTVADTSVVTVTNAPAFIDITSSADTLTSLWDSLPVPVVVLNARGDTLGATSVEWWSQAPLVGPVSAAGLVVARDTGETLVQAKFGRAPGDTLRDSIRVRVLNVPAAVALSDERDTLTALGQSVAYTGEVRNARGAAIAGYPIAWSSTNPAAVTVSTGGVATAVGFGSAMVIGQAASMADTVVNVVVNPTRLIVDNGVTITPRFGTRKRPYARIQDGVNAAEVDDTVFVRKGAAWYSETVALNRRVTLLGDDSTFALSVPRNPLLLPLVSHDTGAAGITAYTTATVVIKNLVLRHTFAGPALDARRADLRVSGFYVNPPGTGAGRIGGGIALDSSASSAATIMDSDIRSVRGYGIRVRDASGVVVDRVTIETVDSVPGQEPGAGIRVLRGSGHTVRRAAVRGTHGPQILVDSSPSATLALNDLAGRQRLMVVRSSNGTTVQDNLFDTRPLGLNGEVFSAGTLFEWAGLEIQASLQIMVTGNSFRDAARADQEPFNGMRLVDVRSPSSPFFGAQTFGNAFLGTRAGIRSERSYLYIQGSRFDSTLTAILGTESDVLVLQDDTLRHALRDRCLTASQSLYISVSGTWFDSCTARAAHAITVNGGFLAIQQSAFTSSRAAVSFTGNTVTARGNAVSGAGFNPGPLDTTALAALELSAPSVTVVQNSITRHPFNAGLRVAAAGATVRIDSNFVSENSQGVRLGALSTLTARDNDVFDNAPAGVVNEVATSVSFPQAWWGDPRGPRGLADPAATGDSVVGAVNAASWSAAPHSGGTVPVTLRSIRGDGQAGAAGTVLTTAFTVRAIDAAGHPVAGVSVTFKVTVGGGTVGGGSRVTVATNASGLAEATLSLDATRGANTVTATAPGLNTVTFTASGT
jgi:nitrous oxidase accessory protein NosD